MLPGKPASGQPIPNVGMCGVRFSVRAAVKLNTLSRCCKICEDTRKVLWAAMILGHMCNGPVLALYVGCGVLCYSCNCQKHNGSNDVIMVFCYS